MIDYRHGAWRLSEAVLAAALCLPGYWSARLAYADWLHRHRWLGSLGRASQLAPGRADLRALLEDWPGAVARDPFDSASWIRLGLAAETAGDFALAERSLLRAAQVDRLYDPRWALANYYFRRQAWEPFWIYARQAAGLSRDTPVALYRLCREATPDFGLIFDNLVAGRPHLVDGFLYWVQPFNDVPALSAVATKGVELARPGPGKALAACAGQLLYLGAAGDARRLWNRMIDRGLLPFEHLDPAAGRSLTNPDFRLPLNAEAFNWALPSVPGVSSRQAGREVRFEFSGSQPEHSELLVQSLPVLGGRRYRVRCRYRTTGIAAGAGPRWLVGGNPPGPPMAAENWSEASWEFETPPAAETIRLVLAYQRIPGTTRITGVFRLESVRLELTAAIGGAAVSPARRFFHSPSESD